MSYFLWKILRTLRAQVAFSRTHNALSLHVCVYTQSRKSAWKSFFFKKKPKKKKTNIFFSFLFWIIWLFLCIVFFFFFFCWLKCCLNGPHSVVVVDLVLQWKRTKRDRLLCPTQHKSRWNMQNETRIFIRASLYNSSIQTDVVLYGQLIIFKIYPTKFKKWRKFHIWKKRERDVKKSESPYNIFSGFQARIVGWPTFSLFIRWSISSWKFFFFLLLRSSPGWENKKEIRGGEVSPREKETRGVGREFRLWRDVKAKVFFSLQKNKKQKNDKRKPYGLYIVPNY